MRYYKMTDTPRQKFSLILPHEEITLELRWIPAAGFWIASIKSAEKADTEVNGVRVVPSIPIFKQYGYPEIIFVSHDNEIGRELSEAELVVLSPQNLEQGSTIDYAIPGRHHDNG